MGQKKCHCIMQEWLYILGVGRGIHSSKCMQEWYIGRFLVQAVQLYTQLVSNLFYSHHGLHVLGGVSQWQTGEAVVPAHEVVVQVSSHQPNHVGQVALVGSQNVVWYTCRLQCLVVHLCTVCIT